MLHLRRCWLLLTLWVVSSKVLAATSPSLDSFETTTASTEDCGDHQLNVDKGMIRLPEFSGDAINCSWTYVAPPDRKLMVKVDSVQLPPSDLRSSVFQLYIDDQLYDIPRNCVKCLREVVGGKTIKVLFSSHVLPDRTHPVDNETGVSESVGSFQVRYKSFDPHRCPKPEQIENGQVISKGRKVGQGVFYRCDPPYELFGEPEANCIIPTDSPVPEWSSQTPSCGIPECNSEPIIREASSAGSIASPGYPTYAYKFTVPCEWLITSQMNQQIKISIQYLKLPKLAEPLNTSNISRLSLIDGDYAYITNLTESITENAMNFTTMTNRLTVKFIVNDNNNNMEGIGFYMNYSAVSSICPKPKPPENGNVGGYSNELGSTITFTCQKDFVLVGESRSECMLNGKWSHPVPSCEPFILGNTSYISATNKSEIVTTRVVEELESSGIPLKPLMKNGKRKGKDFAYLKSSPEPEATEKPTDSPDVSLKNDESKLPESRKKHEKNHGPKSEPHLSQVIPAKNNVRKGKVDDENTATSDDRSDKKQQNISDAEENFPDVDSDDISEDPDSDQFPFKSVTMIAIIAGVGAPLAIAIILLIAILIYRRRYPVRMRFGRKFSTFENPMYVTKDAQHPRELKRLTTP